MAELDRKKLKIMDNKEDQSGDGSQGSQSGGIEFVDFISTRPEKISLEDERQHLAVHLEKHKGLIEKQKKIREQRQASKEGRMMGQSLAAGVGARQSSFAHHPILSQATEFDGVDPQVNADPTIFEAETNSEKQQELVPEHQLRLRYNNEPAHRIKPSPL